MKALEVRFETSPSQPSRVVGTLVEQKGRIYFEYAEAWLTTGFSLSPFRLPFAGGAFEHKDRAFGPLPGLFDDSLPDGWGLLLMDRHWRNLGRDPAALGPLERLAWLGTRTMGALTYHPPTGPLNEADGAFDLEGLALQAQEVLAGKSAAILPQLLRAGGSPGGARSKVLVGFDPVTEELRSGEGNLPAGSEAWLVKFPAREDTAEAGVTEYAYALMARASGLDVPATRLFPTPGGARYFGVKRCDRAPSRRFHVHTFGNLIQTDFRIPSCDYQDLLKATGLLTRNHEEVLKAFRRMAFNVAAHNRDDHAKNFGFILDDQTGAWSLTPAYDLSFSPGPGGEHTMTVAGEGRAPGLDHCLRVAQVAGLSVGEARSILEEVRAGVDRWQELASEAEVPRGHLRRIGEALKKQAASLGR